MNDHQLAAALRATSPDAIAELYDAYGERLFRYCWSMLRNREMALAAVRDTLAAAQAYIVRLTDSESLGPWLYSLARAECRRRRPVPASAPQVVLLSWTAWPSSSGPSGHRWHRRPDGPGPAPEPTSESLSGPGQAASP